MFETRLWWLGGALVPDTTNFDEWVAGGSGLRNRVVTSTDGDVATLPIPREHGRPVEVRAEIWIVGGIPAQTLHSADGTSWSMAAPVPMMIASGGAAAFTPQ